MRVHPSAPAALLAAILGFGFAAVSTYDSAVHLDRQVHGIHCSYMLGLGDTDATGNSGCYATLMSNYSSVFRTVIWGGIPAALPGMAVFGFIAFAVIWIWAHRKNKDVKATGFLVAACGVPFITSIFMGYISLVELDTVCKVCMGIYISSFIAFGSAVWMMLDARKARKVTVDAEPEAEPTLPTTTSGLVKAFLLGGLFTAVPVAGYAFMAPDFSKYVGQCGTLAHPEDPGNVLLPIGDQNRPAEMIEVMDPLCAACGVFERRFDSLTEKERVRRKLMLFPLDNTCNWMIDESLHPGSCAVSEALICAGDRAGSVLSYAVEHQEEILGAASEDPNAAARIMKSSFPDLAQCIGSASARAKLNLSLRWAVKNRLHILTPQIYVDGYRLCDEDTDLGLEYALSRLITKEFVPGAEKPLTEPAPLLPSPSQPSRKQKPTAAKTAVEPASADIAPPTEIPSTAAAPSTETQGPSENPSLDKKLEQVNERLDAILGKDGPEKKAEENAPPALSAPAVEPAPTPETEPEAAP